MNRFAISPGRQVMIIDLGLRVDELLRCAPLPADLFARPESGLTTREYFRMWRAMEEMVDTPAIALRVRPIAEPGRRRISDRPGCGSIRK
ncbi:AraC family transcriptional regulator ligand-binding domain-containing protein [Burkholderia pyrrocinia]|uniref:AraC family transcriptional regulator ligand-binding domain-containing protein n=1 Tax=Burkholderia pyrrocinia TaxID=60550 RepID=UPI00064C4784|nr:AraC family transcriptional regulator ligand-binding domain-containing protein [Burkholderia pyrrocinia]AKM05172.1 hypothetical protein ABD05_33875 [Burkholderia pyrrocinia]